MTDPAIFEDFARSYEESVDRAIRTSGERSRFFAELKARFVREAAPLARGEILDFGCGVGNTTRALAALYPGAQTVGVDPSSESIRVAGRRMRFGGEWYATGARTGLPFSAGTFDLVFAGCVFHHIDRAEHAFWMDELARVLADGGRLFLFEHNPYNPLTRRVVRLCPLDVGVELLSAGYAKSLVEGAGLEAREPVYYFFFPRMLRFLRPLERYLRWLPLGAQYFVSGDAGGPVPGC